MGWTPNWIGKCEHSQARARVCSASACAWSAECASGTVYWVCLLCIVYYAYIYLGSRPRLGQPEDAHANTHVARDQAATNSNANANAKAALNPGPGTHAITSFSFSFLSESKPVRSRKSDADHAADALLSLLLVQPTGFPQGRSSGSGAVLAVVRLGMGPGRAEGPVTRYVAWILAGMLVLTRCIATSMLSLSASFSPPAGVLDYFLFRRYFNPDRDPETDMGDLKVSIQYTSTH